MLDDASQHAESLSIILPGILTTGTALSNKKLGLCCPVPFSTTLCDVLSGLPVVHGGNWIRLLRLWRSLESFVDAEPGQGKGKLTMSEIKKRLQTFYKDVRWDPVACDHQRLKRTKESFQYEQVWWRASMYCMPTYLSALSLPPKLRVPSWESWLYSSIVSGHHHERGEVPAE